MFLFYKFCYIQKHILFEFVKFPPILFRTTKKTSKKITKQILLTNKTYFVGAFCYFFIWIEAATNPFGRCGVIYSTFNLSPNSVTGQTKLTSLRICYRFKVLVFELLWMQLLFCGSLLNIFLTDDAKGLNWRICFDWIWSGFANCSIFERSLLL